MSATPGVCSVCGRKAFVPGGTCCYRHRTPPPGTHGDYPLPASRKVGSCGQGGCRNVPAPGKETCEPCLARSSAAKKRDRAGARAARDYLEAQWAANSARKKSP